MTVTVTVTGTDMRRPLLRGTNTSLSCTAHAAKVPCTEFAFTHPTRRAMFTAAAMCEADEVIWPATQNHCPKLQSALHAPRRARCVAEAFVHFAHKGTYPCT
jgi:hypothetical protein